VIRATQSRLPGVVILEPEVHADERGFFVETYRATDLAAVGLGDVMFVQENHSRSGHGTLRGLHFSIQPGQAKLVRVARGRILDVALDIRRGSPTFGQHEAVELDDVAHRQLFLPVGIAHGFVVLSDVADVCYRVDAYYDPALERGVAWDDSALGIAWPVEGPILSARDRSNPTLAELPPELTAWD
jgi:dTDP-4-dehydrorhamnose 3,5-epimerase